MSDNGFMLTTIDNPYDPFDQFDSWLMFDKLRNYNCNERVARIARISDEMSQKEIDEEVDRAIDEIIKYDFIGIYKKVKKKTASSEVNEQNNN